VSLFFALWPPRETARALAAWAEEVRRDAGGRATAEPDIHLTLAFLGKADPAQASTAAECVSVAPFALSIDTAKYWKHNKIVWVGPATLPRPLSGLVDQLHADLRATGFVLEERPFAAHVTLLRKAAAPRSIRPLPPLSRPATEFTLVRSTSTGTGSRYDVLERYSLVGD
jgi:2'-5' RNA ligase